MQTEEKGLNIEIDYSDNLLREHNQEVYEKIVEEYNKTNRVLIEQATGTGKSFLAMKLIKDYALKQKKKVLFICPTLIIEDAFKEHCEEYIKAKHINTCLYAGLSKEVEKEYDLIIFDEAHRVGAEIWGENVKKLLNNNPNAKVLGMTATLERQDGVSVEEVLEVEKVTSRITLAEAIEQGILPAPNYTLANINFKDDLNMLETSEKEFKERLNQASIENNKEEAKELWKLLLELNKAKRMISECEELPTMFKNSLNTEELKKGKYLVFCPQGSDEESLIDIKKLERIMEDAKSWFKEINEVEMYSIHSTYGERRNKKALEAFEKDESDKLKVMFAVNMLNEGKHIEGIDGVIMLRKTTSQVIYLQQLGRVLSYTDKAKQPLVFDLVANLNENTIVYMQELVKGINTKRKENDLERETQENKGRREGLDREFSLIIKNIEVYDFIKKLKENIYAYGNEEKFRKIVFELQKYKDIYKNLLVPVRYVTEEGYKLGQKVHNIRTGRIKLTSDQEKELEDMGFVKNVW